MISYILKILYFVVFSFFTIYAYYSDKSHVENLWYILPGILPMLSFYSIYKIGNFIKKQEELNFKPIYFFGFFLIQLFISSVTLFILTWNSWVNWFTLFFKSLWYLFLPIIISLTSIWFWKFLTHKIPNIEKETSIFRFLLSIWVWFCSFIMTLFIVWSLWFYNLYSFFIILFWFIAISYKEQLGLLKSLFTYEIKVKDHKYVWWNIFEKINLYLLSWEFFFLVISFLIGVNLISIVRPMPIWWDEMWVYMNYPQIMANAGKIWNLWWSLTWLAFTGIWYMFKSATQAFYLNNIWSVFSVIVIILALYDLLKDKTKKLFLNIYMFAWALFVSMPMVIFQQAKDQKLDSGVFFISTIIVYLTYYIFLKYLWYKRSYKTDNFEISSDSSSESSELELKIKNNSFLSYFKKYVHIWESDIFSKKEYLIYVLIIWILLGFAFGLKFTSLLLISGIISVFFYAKLWVAWMFSYISLYIWIFTKANLWSKMNVAFAETSQDKDIIFFTSLIISFVLLWYSFYKYKLKTIKKTLKLLIILFIWIFIWFWPNLIKNIRSSIWEPITTSILLSWKSEYFKVDYSKIYSEEELSNIENKYKKDEWKPNEDFWRYIWYEEWINNYIKLPYNLTMQENQWGEFTNITFLYFILIFISVLFFSYKNKKYLYGIFSLNLFFGIFYFSLFVNNNFSKYLNNEKIPEFFKKIILFFSTINNFFTEIFAKTNFPIWYFVIFLILAIPVIYLLYTLKRNKSSVLLRLNLVFGLFYIFLWTISSYWVVWYWIVMYFVFLLSILVWLKKAVSYSKWEDNKNVKFIWSIVVFLVILIHFIFSAIPHGVSNLRSAYALSFKVWKVTKYESIIMNKKEFLELFSEVNLKDKNKLVEYVKDSSSEELQKLITEYKWTSVTSLDKVLKAIISVKENTPQLNSLKKEAKQKLNVLYRNIFYPQKDNINNSWVYRIWTFLKYYTINNNIRLYWDALLTNFQKYFYDENDMDLAFERIKKLWMTYLYVDLNAATIDRAPEKDLTTRYENLLTSLTSDKISLVSTDSVCLKTWLYAYQDDLISQDQFVKIAWVNYYSYKDWNLSFTTDVKKAHCYNLILDLLSKRKENEEKYSYLLTYKDWIQKLTDLSEKWLLSYFNSVINRSTMAVFKIK